MPVSVNACVPQLRFEEVENKTASLARQMEQAIENRTRALHVAMSSPPPHPDPPKLGRPRLRCAAQIIPYRLLTTPPRLDDPSTVRPSEFRSQRPFETSNETSLVWV